jgi:hypothetical protein
MAAAGRTNLAVAARRVRPSAQKDGNAARSDEAEHDEKKR